MKWVTNWSNSISINTNRPEMYGKDITFRYPIRSIFNSSKGRITLDNFTSPDAVTFQNITIAKTAKDSSIDLTTLKPVTFHNQKSIKIAPGSNAVSDPIDLDIKKGEYFTISFYFSDFTNLLPAITTLGPYTKGYYSLHDQTASQDLPVDLTKSTNGQYYFLSDVELYTEDNCKSLLCFGDSITAQSWVDELQDLLIDKNISVCRKAVSGARLLRQYECIEYNSYGLKSSIRFPHDVKISGCDSVIILEGINDMIHPVGIEINKFRPISDFPSLDDMIAGYQNLIGIAKKENYKVYIGTLLPIKGWRTYAQFREDFRNQVNQWIRSNSDCDGCIDFDAALADKDDPSSLAKSYDSGDHLHPSSLGAKEMAQTVYNQLYK